MSYITCVEYDAATEEHFVTIPPDLLAVLGWQEGDALAWTLEKDHLVLRRITET